MSDVTRILERVQQGEAKAAEELLPLVYDELRRLAHHKMSLLPPGHTLQATALVHEAWLRLSGDQAARSSWDSRGHFFSAAAEAMRRILVEQARRKAARRHGGGMRRVDLDDVDLAEETNSDVLLLVDEALDRLTAVDSQAAQLVKLRFFVGLPNAQAAEMLGLAERTAKRSWAYARAWLLRELKKEIRGE
ncbi:MAG TPA: sigma-70 family RNA polymerase sigma factor [Candidatus Paceibacterota bacterium]|nr:sigma-70 family RNA polymerase sigma factor [Candidatus Paceibacterota bacterium]